MSWIKDNKFVATLSGVTLVGAALLIAVGVKGCQTTRQAKIEFDAATDAAMGFEKLPLYPKEENFNGKQKALSQYIKQADELQAAFEKYRPQPTEKISPQDFADRLKAAEAEVRKAFGDSKATLPAGFFLGFENYTGALARESATGILDYQLGAVKGILLSLAAAGPAELINLHRPKLAEEEGQEFKSDGMVARPLSLEITFRGSEKATREFLTELGKNTEKFVVIRSLRITNQKVTAPLSSDGKFETEIESEAAPAGTFVIGEPAATADAAPAAPAADSSQILAQVLGKEDIQVFLRLDILQFLPAKALPKP